MLTLVPQVSTGDLFPAPYWNTYVANNLNWLITAGASIGGAGTLIPTNEFHIVTGATTLDTLSPVSPVAGQRVRLLFQNALLIRNNGGGIGNIRFLNGADHVTQPNEIVTFIYDGTNWREASPQGGAGLIYDNLLGAPATSVSTGTLPTSFKHLLVVTYLRTSSGNNGLDLCGIRLNGDGGSNYDYTSATGGTHLGILQGVGGAGVANLYAASWALIPYYNGGANRKVAIGVSGGAWGNSSVNTSTLLAVGSWRTNATPITSLTFVATPTPGTTNFAADSKITVYGLN